MQSSALSVALTRCSGYDESELDQAIARLLAAVDGPLSPRSGRVLLKPNLLSARFGGLACTDGRFILAVARCLVDQGAMVSVGDSPAFGDAETVLASIGALEGLRRLGVRVDNFKVKRRVRLASGVRASLAAEALDCDLLVNLPKIKAHAQVRVTLAVKNTFGCLVGLRKPLWHMVHGGKAGRFESLIVELLDLLPPGLSLVDGVRVMSRTGPLLGEGLDAGLLGCSANPVALDTALLAVLGVAPEDSPLWRACARLDLPGHRLEDLDFPLLDPMAARVEGFRVPLHLNPIRFRPTRFLRGNLRRLLIALRLSK